MAEATQTVAESGNSRVDDICIYTLTFAAAGDFSYIPCHGYDYASFIPVGPDGTEPGSGTTSFNCYAGTNVDSGTLAVANTALIAEEAGVHLRATVTSAARTYGYLYRLPKVLCVEMSGGTTPANLVLRVELRKRRSMGTMVGRG